MGAATGPHFQGATAEKAVPFPSAGPVDPKPAASRFTAAQAQPIVAYHASPHPRWPARRRRRVPKPDRRSALELLARCSAEGCTEALMLANDFTVDMLVELVRGGLASAETERMVAAGKTIEVARLRITEAGRRMLVPGWRKDHA
jgi:hypothetical protein